ncbi:MAG: ABC transporter permease [Oscillospiraceae bacterium]|nr:ABC transporter permease [Oscillospiraceae bacterium]
MLKAYLQTFKKYSRLIMQLAHNQITLKYRKSYLGMLWSLLNPLLMILVLNFVFSSIFSRNIENFPVFLMCGRLIWDYHSESTKSAMGSIVGNSSLIKKVYVPKYAFPLSNSIAALVNMMFSLIALVIVMIFTHVQLRWTMLLFWVPMIYVFIFSTGLGLILAALNVFFRDVKYLYGVFLTLWMYLSALFYPAESLSEEAQQLIRFNPIFRYIDMMRGIILYGVMPTIKDNVICLSVGIAVLAVGFILFKKAQGRFILHI